MVRRGGDARVRRHHSVVLEGYGGHDREATRGYVWNYHTVSLSHF